LKRSGDFSFTKEEERKKLEQLRNEVQALRGEPMDLESTVVTPMTPSTPSAYERQSFISPAVDMTPTASAKRRREQQLTELKKLRSEAFQLSSSKGGATPSTPTTPSLLNMQPKNHISPPPARKLDFGGQFSTPDTKPPQSNLIVSVNVGNNSAKTTPASYMPSPSKISFITAPTVPVISAPLTQPKNIPVSVPSIQTNVPIPSHPTNDDVDEDSHEDSKPRKKRQLSDTDLDPQKKSSLISATTNFPPIPTKIVSPNTKASPTKPSRSQVLLNAQGFDFNFGAPLGAPSTSTTTLANVSPFNVGSTDTTGNSSGVKTAPFSFGAPTPDTSAFGFSTPASGASPFGFATTTPVTTANKPKDQTDNKSGPVASPFSFGVPQKSEEKKPEKVVTAPFVGVTSRPEEKPEDKHAAASPAPFGFSFGNTSAAKPEEKTSGVTALVDNNSPFMFNTNKPGTIPTQVDFGSGKPVGQSTLDSSVKSELSASELMKSDRSVESTGWREERGQNFGSERNELFKETVLSPSSSQRSDNQESRVDKSSDETDSEREEEGEREESEESYHSDDSEGWFTGPAPKSKPLNGNAPLISTPTKADKMSQVKSDQSKTNTNALEFPTPSFGGADKSKDGAKENKLSDTSAASLTTKSINDKKTDVTTPVFSFSPRRLDQAEGRKPEGGFAFGFGTDAPTFSFGEPKEKTPEKSPTASPNLSFESFTPRLDPEESSGFDDIPSFSLSGKAPSAMPAFGSDLPKEDKVDAKKSEGETKTGEKEEGSSTVVSFGFGAPSSDKAEQKKSTFDFRSPTFSFGQAETLTESNEEKKQEVVAFSFGFGTPAEKPKEDKSVGQSETESFNESVKTEEKSKDEIKSEEPKSEEKKSDTSSTSFGVGFDTPSFGTTPSFSFGQTAEPAITGGKPEEPKEPSTHADPKEESKLDEKPDDNKLDLSAMGAATFTFGQSDEKSEVPQSNFTFSLSHGMLNTDKTAKDKSSKHLKNPMKPIPSESDDEDSDSDDEKPVKSKNNNTSNTSTTSFTLTPSSFSFSPSSFNVPINTTMDPSNNETPKFDLSGIQFGESSMTKRLGSDFGLTDDNTHKMHVTNTNTLSGGDGVLNFSSGDKIFGQVSVSPLTSFSSFTKAEDKNKTEAEEKEGEAKDNEIKHEETAVHEHKDTQEKVDESSVIDSAVSEPEENKSVNQSIEESASESVNTTIEASHETHSDSDPASASDEEPEGDLSSVTDALGEKHMTPLSHVSEKKL